MPPRVLSALSFVGSLLGSIYVAMMVGCFVHELLGHGLTAIALGGRFLQFQVDPAAHGWAYYVDVPDRLEWIPLWAGIGVNLVFGLVAVVVAGRRTFTSPHVALAVVVVAAAHTGQAIGYALQGAVSGAGDAASLYTDLHGGAHVLVIGLLAVAYLLLLDWTLRRFVGLVDRQFAPPDRRSRRRWFAGTVLLPFAVLMAARPASTVFSPTVDWASRAALFALVSAGGMWRCGAPPAAAIPGPPLGWRGALAWVLGAAALAAIAVAWTSRGVSLSGSPS